MRSHKYIKVFNHHNKQLPVPLLGLAQSLEYPVKIGLSDAYYVDSDKSSECLVVILGVYAVFFLLFHAWNMLRFKF